ncbi:MAG TPA: ABC transporter substrate-binding protein, partial [Roseomonas sp.]|nr:ABC transporter substrate-binding protein [Roseomonas sp.]
MRLVPAALAALMLTAAPAAMARSLSWSFSADILTLDPHSSNNTFTNAFLDNVYETLVRHTQRLELEPALATSWERVTPTVWRFQLRDGVRFHNGETFGAEDVVFSWQRLNTPGALARGVLAGVIKEVRATGPLTVEIETERPFPILLNALTQMHIMDAGWAAANNATAATNLQAREETGASRGANGTGPFRVRSRQIDGPTVLLPFEGWWDR